MSDAQAAAAPAKPGKKKFVLLLAALLLVGGGGAGGAWFFLHKKAGDGDAEEAHAEAKSAAKPLFLTLEPFTVNLKDPRGDRFAQVGVTLQYEDPKLEVDIKDRLPAVRNQILLLISSKEIEELLTMEGKQRLAQEIRLQAGRAIGLDLPDLPPSASASASAPVAVAAAQPASAPAKAQADAQGEDDEAPRPKKARGHRKAPAVVNPISQVLFSQFIVQ